jgi:DNA-binding MarR family transcriptional regulator
VVPKLTEKEKLVFFGLVRWPQYSDGELAEKLGLGRSTVTSIRNRLEGEKLYSEVNVPDLEKIGCEVFTALYGEFRPTAMYRKHAKDLENEFASMFFMMSMGPHKVSFGAGKNFTDMGRHIEDYHDRHQKVGFSSEKKHTQVMLPLKLSRIHRFFDYAPLLKEYFGLSVPEEPENRVLRKITLSGSEKEVLAALVRFPQASDGELAAATGLSRQTVGAIEKKLFDEGVVRKVRVPDVGKLGFELLAFTHLHMNPRKGMDERSEGIQRMMGSSANVLKVSGNLEGVTLSVFRDYTEYLRGHGKVLDYYKEKGLLVEEPTIKLFSTREADLEMHHRYAPLVEGVLMSTE